MAITEESRHDLYLRLEAALGREEATTLMEHLPPVGWADVATKYDLALQSALLRTDFDALRGGFEAHRVATKQDLDVQSALLRTDFDALRGEFEAHRVATKQDLDVQSKLIRSELRSEIGQLRVDIADKFNRLLFQLLASMAGFISLVLVLSRKG